MSPTMTRLRRAASWLLLGWGAALLVRPRESAAAVLGGAPIPPEPIIRVLGGRRAAQQLVLLLRPGIGTGTVAAGVDVIHALSMGIAAVLWPEYRRAALTSAGVATGSALVAGRVAAAARRRDDLWVPE
jgi:hypothetical protein